MKIMNVLSVIFPKTRVHMLITFTKGGTQHCYNIILGTYVLCATFNVVHPYFNINV